jgi:hypothetical protein
MTNTEEGCSFRILPGDTRWNAVEACDCAQRPEGSRFGSYPASLATFFSRLVQPEQVKTGGSRELPSGLQFQQDAA